MASETNVFTRLMASAPDCSAACASGSMRATLGDSLTIKGRRASGRIRLDQFAEQRGVARKVDAAVLGVGTRNVQLVSRDAFGVFQDADHFGVVARLRIRKRWRKSRSEAGASAGSFSVDEGAHADVLQADGVDHAGFGLPQARRRIAGDRLARKSFDHQAAHGVQIGDAGEFDAVAVGS